MADTKKILIVLSSHDKLANTGKPTGWFLPELAHPYFEFQDAGVEMTIASPLGGTAPLDPLSIKMFENDEHSIKFLNENKSVWENTAKVSTFLGKADEFDAIFYPGGHGPMFDLAVDEQSQQLVAEFAAKDKVVSAVCHGPAAFLGVKVNGENLLRGKQLTGFTNEEETIVGLADVMPFLLEDKMKEVGGESAKFLTAGEPWGVKVVVDGKLITGQNPASSKGVAEAILKALSS